MPLNYPADWKFTTIGFAVDQQTVEDFIDLIVSTASGDQSIVETFKMAFGGTAESSSYEWAVEDLRTLAADKANNAAVFVDDLWSGLERCRANHNVPVPEATHVNHILADHGVELVVDPPNLICPNRIDVAEATETGEGTNTGVRYDRHERLGVGGFGQVYRVTRTTEVGEFQNAMKILDPSPFVEDRDRALERFRREIEAVGRLQHRAIIQFFEAGLTLDRVPYILMPFVEGADIRTATVDMQAAERLEIFVEVLRALDYAHGQGVLHRDLKPGNIMIRASDRQAIILDFGAAYLLDELDQATLTTHAVGTAGYIPSEVLAAPTRRTKLHDVYSCGIMLYEVFAGRRPDPGRYEPLTGLGDRLAGLSEVVWRAIRGEDERTPNAGQFAGELEELLQ